MIAEDRRRRRAGRSGDRSRPPTIRDIRNFILGLRPELLDGADLAERARVAGRRVPPEPAIELELDLPTRGLLDAA